MALRSTTLQAALGGFERRHRAVLCADIAGYTRLMEADEIGTFERIRMLRVSVVDPAIVSRRGEIVKHTGDGFIAVFESPADAVRCATDIQAEVLGQERDIPPERRIQMRIGLHWDSIIIEGHDVFGTGVNLSARLQTAAPPGGTVVSSELLDQLGDDPGFRSHDLGLLVAKNVSRPLRAHLIPPPGSGRLHGDALSTWQPGRARPPSVAVMPFAEHRPDGIDGYFGEGFVEDIVLTLSNVSEILVVARGSTLALRRESMNPERVSGKLGTRYVLNGSIRRLPGRLRISVEFTDAAAMSVIWAERYEIPETEIFVLQDEIALKVVSKIATSVRLAEVRRVMRKPPRSLNAYDLLLRALDLMFRMDYASFSEARGLLERAIAEDREYAGPYAFLAQWHVFALCEGWSVNNRDDEAQMLRLAEAALDRDAANVLAMGIKALGRAMFSGDRDEAIELADRAIATSPNSSWACIYGAIPCGFVGKAALGVERAERAIRLSPLDLQAFFNYCVLAQNHYLNGNVEEAIRWSRRSMQLNPRFGNAIRVLTASLVATGEQGEAEAVARHHREVLPGFRTSDYRKRCPFLPEQADLYVTRLQAAGLHE